MGMIHRAVDLGTVTILSGETESTVMDFSKYRGSVNSITIYGPGELTGTVRLQTTLDQDPPEWRDKQSGGSDITIPADGSVKVLAMDFRKLRIKSNNTESEERNFRIVGEEGP